jgi:hypothetical protein
MRACLAALLLLAACEGAIGTIDIDIVTAPGAAPLADVTRVRLTLDNPPAVVDSVRDANGAFELALEVNAEGTSGFVTFEGFDAGDTVVAWGRSGALPVAAIDAFISIYVAAPDTIAAAPVSLDPPRSEMGHALLPFGVLWAGGRDATGAPVDPLTIYNVYTHDFQEGEPLPEPRAGVAAGSGLFDFVYLFGGENSDGDATDQFWRFDTQEPPAGVYLEFAGVDDGLARTGAHMALIGTEQLVLTGEPGALLDGTFSRATALDDPPLDGLPVTLVFDELGVETLVAGAGAGTAGAVVYDTGQWIDLEDAQATTAARTGHGLVNLPNGDALIVGGGNGDGLLGEAVVYRRASRELETIVGFLDTPRRDAAVARAGNRIIVAGGTDADGVVLGDAEVFDAETLAPLSVLPLLVARTGASAGPLGNGQIIVSGGTDIDGAPIATLELYTP